MKNSKEIHGKNINNEFINFSTLLIKYQYFVYIKTFLMYSTNQFLVTRLYKKITSCHFFSTDFLLKN